MYRQWVPCERNSSYNFIPILLKLCTCFLHGLKMCTWFGYNSCINFCHFFHFVNLVIFRPQCIDSGYLVSATPHTILYQSFWNFAHVFSMVWRCARGLDIILTFIFVTFSTLWTWVIFRHQCIDSGYLVRATPHTILYQSFWNFAHVFSMVWRCAYDLDIVLALMFVTFSTLWTLSFSDLRFYENVVTVGTLWAQLLIQLYTNLFETLYMFSPWSGDMHMVWI